MFIRNIKHFLGFNQFRSRYVSLEGSCFCVVFAIDLIRIKTIRKGSAEAELGRKGKEEDETAKVVIITNNNPVSN